MSSERACLLTIKCLASWIRLYVSIGGWGFVSRAVPRTGVKAKRAGETPMSTHLWIRLTASFSVSPKPMIMCVLTLPFPKTSMASRSCLNWFSHVYGPFAFAPFTLLNISSVVASMAMPILSAPASARRFMFCAFRGWQETEMGTFVCCFRVLTKAVRWVKTSG